MFDFALLIPLLAIALPMVIAIVALLTEHQRKMTELIHKNHSQSDSTLQQMAAELNEVRRTMGQLNDRVNQLSISADDASSERALPHSVNQ
ncbi:MAG: hypothetical protein ABUL72_06315 [Armatimonadota bacterium]